MGYSPSAVARSLVTRRTLTSVDGIIVTSSRLAASYIVLQQQLGIPIVLTNCCQYIYSVSIDNLHGGRLAVDYLLQLGHTRIGYIANRDREQANADRMTGYRQALQQRGIAFDPALIALGGGLL